MEHFLIVARAHRLKHVAMWVGDHVILVVTGQAQETLAEAQTALIADGWKIERADIGKLVASRNDAPLSMEMFGDV